MKPKRIKKLSIEKREDGWWIIDPNNEDCGPYGTRAEAQEEKPGLERFWKFYHERTPEEIYQYEHPE